MKTPRSLWLGAGLLGLATLAICAGHARLTQFLVRPLVDAEVDDPARFATVLASLVVHIVAAIWILPYALRLARFGLSRNAIRMAIYSSMAMVFLRVAVEMGTGTIVQGLPFVGVAFALTGLAVARSWPDSGRQRRAELHAIAGGRQPAAARIDERRRRAS